MKPVSRRHWMTLCAGAASAASLTLSGPSRGLRAVAAAANAPFKLGMVTYKMGEKMTCDQLIALCKEAGLAGVELRTTHGHGVELSLSKSERADVRKKFEDSGVVLVGLGSTYEFHSNNPAVVKKNIEGAKEYAQLAADVGAGGIKVRPNGVNKGEELAVTHERIGKAWGEVAAAAAGLGVEVRMEVHGSEGSREPKSVRAMLDHANHANAKVCWNCNGGETDENGSIRANFDLLKHALGLVHINDIGVPKYPWQELFDLLKECGYSGYCLAEIEGNDDPARFMRYYRTLFDLYTGQPTWPA
ncbi:MAG TPA: sugar phosphate isomerase/epimerase family protein [Candidatus Hydrogenedentes bacterium]|nr:sugar phosphate isomerase/epimerase family protein [Candidatus Hydrogenedentota bacterium]HOH49998.1 sugar phosphate isomerase/epimerase family protein [Candidatus Hydrogenedentota bacterium]